MTTHSFRLPPMRPLDEVRRPAAAMPAGACDTHMHIFGPLSEYPMYPKSRYPLPEGATYEHWLALMERLGLERFVIVQPSFYDTDNRFALDVLKWAGQRARGVAMIDLDISDQELERYHALGVRAVRVDLFKRAALPISEIEDYVRAIVARIAPLGWHLQFYAPGNVVRDLLGLMARLDMDLVVDHMGYMLHDETLTDADFERLLDLTVNARVHIKLTGAYRLRKDGDYSAVHRVARAIVERAPDRTIWGTDWPHVPYLGFDTGELVDMLSIWAPDDETRRKTLVDNPARMFGFDAS